ncbi:MAG: ectoine hydroxylase-related dioxygenase (phytanoyl-CoA dioxygenase family) [Candidatus Pelagisphaera sp.]|jgi:ectoine hydroxylase-related dioxygenase (phytanoyl-CoA dioxygenase family)
MSQDPITPHKLTDAERTFYHENGYLVIEDLVSKEQCDKLIQASEEVAKNDYRSYLTMHHKSETFRDTLRNQNLVDLLDDIQDHRMIPIGSVYFFCKPNNEKEKGSLWHQDNYAAKAPNGSYLVCAIALDDADKENGSLVVAPRTHTLGDLPNRPKANFTKDEQGNVIQHPFGNETEVPDGYPPLQLEYRKGSVIVMHAHTLHSAPANPSQTRWRRKWYMHYIKDGHPFWPGWSAKRNLIERFDSQYTT